MDFKPEIIAGLVAGFAVLGTVFGMVLRGWSAIKSFFHSIFSLIITEIHLEDDQTSQAVMSHLIKNYRHSQMGQRTFGGRHESFRSGKFGHIPYEFYGGHCIIFWRGLLPFLFKVTPEKSDDKQQVILFGSKPKPTVKSSIFYLRGTVNAEKIIKCASQERNELYWANGINDHKRFFIKRIPDATKAANQRFSAGTNLAWYHEGVYRLLAHEPDDLGRASVIVGNGSSTDNLYFPKPVMKALREVEVWRKRQQWYLDRGIPWKGGLLFYGPPGTGKTAITRAIAEDQDMPLFVYSLGQMLNDELERSWIEMQAHVPCFAVFEDFDTVFFKRENIYGKPNIASVMAANNPNQQNQNQSVVKQGQLSFDCLLNCLDGVEKSNGIYVIITTNNIDALDEAIGVPTKNGANFISTRPGRIDKAIELGYMENEDKIKLAKRIFLDDEQGFKKMCKLIESEEQKETPAQFQQRCKEMALESIKEVDAQEIAQDSPWLHLKCNGHCKAKGLCKGVCRSKS